MHCRPIDCGTWLDLDLLQYGDGRVPWPGIGEKTRILRVTRQTTEFGWNSDESAEWLFVGHVFSENDIRFCFINVPAIRTKKPQRSFVFTFSWFSFQAVSIFLSGKLILYKRRSESFWCVTEPVSGWVAGSGKCLDLSRVRNIRTSTQIDKITTFIYRGTATIWSLCWQNRHLATKVCRQTTFLGDHHTLEFLFLFDDLVLTSFSTGSSA